MAQRHLSQEVVNGEHEMKLRYIAPVAMAATAAAIGFAPLAAAAPIGVTTSTGATVVQTPGNAQVTAQPGVAAQHANQLQSPYFLDGDGGLLFHHGAFRGR